MAYLDIVWQHSNGHIFSLAMTVIDADDSHVFPCSTFEIDLLCK
jgi:hypothetical protein